MTSGLMEALRAVGATLAETLRVRGALLGVEVREELERRKQMLLLAALGAAFLHMALLLATLMGVAFFWETHRILALGIAVIFYAGCGAAAFARLREAIASSPEPFAATREELDQDLAGLRHGP